MQLYVFVFLYKRIGNTMACFYSKITGGDRMEGIDGGKGHEKWDSQRRTEYRNGDQSRGTQSRSS